MSHRNWRFYTLHNCPPVEKRENIAHEYDADTHRLSIINRTDELGVYMAHIYINPANLAALGPIIADLISEAQKAGYLEAQRDIRRALGV